MITFVFFSMQLCRWGTSLITTNFLLIVTDIGSKAQYNQVSNEYLSSVILALFLTALIAVVMSLIARSKTYYRFYNGTNGVPKPIIIYTNILGALSLIASYMIIY